jgi:hypothetical protein
MYLPWVKDMAKRFVSLPSTNAFSQLNFIFPGSNSQQITILFSALTTENNRYPTADGKS